MNTLETRFKLLVKKLDKDYDYIDDLRPRIQDVIEKMLENNLKDKLEALIWYRQVIRTPNIFYNKPNFDYAVKDFIGSMKVYNYPLTYNLKKSLEKNIS